MPPTPITIITGFLGAGKTTLVLNLVPQLRAADPDYRLALIKNEFGDVAVDSQLAAASAVSGVRELLGGCVCCNLVGSLADALEELTTTDIAPNRIVIETSGSAFPATLALEVNRLARAHPGRYILDGVVSVIDVENWRGYEDTSYTARLQARYTDLVVLNKWETAGDRRLDEVRDRLGDLEIEVAWVKSRRGWVDVGVVFGIDGVLARRLIEMEKEEEHTHGSDHGHVHDHGDHQSEVEVLSIELTGPPGSCIAIDSLSRILRAAPKDEVYRIKAVLVASQVPENSDNEPPLVQPESMSGRPGSVGHSARWILNWAFARWTFTSLPSSLPAPRDAATGHTNSGHTNSGHTNSGHTNSGHTNSGHTNSGHTNSGHTDSGHASGQGPVLRMTMILARHESGKWMKKVQEGKFIELQGGQEGGSLKVTKLA